ncbi:MAG TPA: F0F1 ATP synthase subunit A [Methylomusa anaerophila]|uniref:ATP synthase subunit a n=1 Tax=Methylomusa anaerophila TaxID=1930071 RepID=A0A348AKC6_9FIRM|nr:F0F1 ATP synthase subunit A [Methylomusa anaerophila]BBB91524.1 ATP synthase subunit a [Methylomusa anaerophila]HML89538.1 F0F1 ATP synthase subunit A [Methylomusa anaerophila]
MGHGHEIGSHKLAHLAGLTFHLDTLYMTWLTMAIVILLAVLATRRLSLVPGGWQNCLEIAVTALMGQIESTLGPKGQKWAPMIITLFLFLLVGNELGLIPGFTSPTNDLNTSFGLALMVLVLVHVLAIVNKGPVRYIKHYFEPFLPFVIINLIEEIAKLITLSFRLFGNIVAGEILLIILGMLVPYVVPTAWLAFSVFVGLIQAFLFTMLSMSYLANSLQDGQH